MGLIHEPNTTQWRPGDLVIHDSDAKRADMLMIILERDATGIFRTRYAFPWAQPRPWRRKIWRNTLEWLHDPARFWDHRSTSGYVFKRAFLSAPIQN